MSLIFPTHEADYVFTTEEPLLRTRLADLEPLGDPISESLGGDVTSPKNLLSQIQLAGSNPACRETSLTIGVSAPYSVFAHEKTL